MSLQNPALVATDQASPSVRATRGVPEAARILIVCDDNALTEQLSRALRREGYCLECVSNVTAGCAAVRSGRIQVVFTAPVLGDGSWRRLVDVVSLNDLASVVVLVAGRFYFNQWAEALQDGAFDILDANHELPKTSEVARRALWAAYLKGAGGLHPEDFMPPRAA